MNAKMSPYNPAVPGRRMIFCDTTMREGEQSAGVSFTAQEKMTFARKLDEAGVPQIQFYPGDTRESREVVRRIAAMGLKADIVINSVCFEKNWKDRINTSVDCGTDVLHLSYYSTPQCALQWDSSTPSRILEVIAESVEYARSQTGLVIETAFIDATRADEAYLFRQIETALRAGSDRICLPDTVGVANPGGIRYLVERAVAAAKPYGKLVGVHTHNDFGLALANALAGYEAGAGLIDVSVNGLGDRAGNAALAEVVVALESMYGQPTGIQLSRLMDISRYCSEISRRPIPVNQPLVGAHVFSNQDDFHVAAQARDPLAYRGILAGDIGAEEKVFFGKATGPNVVRMMLAKRGRTADDELTERICAALGRRAEARKGIALEEADFWEVATELEGQGLA